MCGYIEHIEPDYKNKDQECYVYEFLPGTEVQARSVYPEAPDPHLGAHSKFSCSTDARPLKNRPLPKLRVTELRRVYPNCGIRYAI
jgi:hypothetical protein